MPLRATSLGPSMGGATRLKTPLTTRWAQARRLSPANTYEERAGFLALDILSSYMDSAGDIYLCKLGFCGPTTARGAPPSYRAVFRNIRAAGSFCRGIFRVYVSGGVVLPRRRSDIPFGRSITHAA